MSYKIVASKTVVEILVIASSRTRSWCVSPPVKEGQPPQRFVTPKTALLRKRKQGLVVASDGRKNGLYAPPNVVS